MLFRSIAGTGDLLSNHALVILQSKVNAEVRYQPTTKIQKRTRSSSVMAISLLLRSGLPVCLVNCKKKMPCLTVGIKTPFYEFEDIPQRIRHSENKNVM